MAYRFSLEDRTIQAAVRRIAGEQIDAACAVLEDESLPFPRRIHEARKAVKKLRGLIRLVRPGFRSYRAENAALRDAGMTIRALRDAEVMLATFDGLATTAGLEAGDVSALRAPLEARKAAAEDPAAISESLAAFRRAMAELHERAETWKVAGSGFDTPGAGLARTWADARAAMTAARRKPTPEAVHLWRKRVKDHWYQARLLAPIWPGVMQAQIAQADALGQLLGDHNDLSALAAELAEAADSPARSALLAAAASRQAALLERALPLSRRLLAGPPEALTARWRVWWKVWRG